MEVALCPIMTRSVPEKTFEHWASMYVAHRFPYGSLWWPTLGEDVSVDDLGTVPGKAMLLEFKVPEQQKNGTHAVIIDVLQLHSYLGSPVPVYYAFPEPPWNGTLTGSTWLGPERRADLAYRRTGHRWFGEWTVVCSAAALLQHLNPAAAKKATVPVPLPVGWRWSEFWRQYGTCGSTAMPSLFIVPENVSGSHPAPVMHRRELRRQLGELRRRSLEQHGRPRERARDALRDASRYFYAPASPATDTDEYRFIRREELDDIFTGMFRRDVAARPEDTQDLAVCAIPFDGLDLA